jgi:hypothetical protein
MLRPGPGRALDVVLAAARNRPLPALQGPDRPAHPSRRAGDRARAGRRRRPRVVRWELAALAWLALIAVPLAFIDAAVQRLPDLLTISAFTGTLALLAAAGGTAHQPWPLVRAVIGAGALAGFYLAL